MPPKKAKKEEPKEKSQKEIDFENLSSFFEKYISSDSLIVKSATLFDMKRIQYIRNVILNENRYR